MLKIKGKAGAQVQRDEIALDGLACLEESAFIGRPYSEDVVCRCKSG